MKRSQRVLTVLFIVSVAVSVLPAAASANGGWSRVWGDEFNGAAGNGGQSVGMEIQHRDPGVFGTGEIETMTASTRNVRVDGHGNLPDHRTRSRPVVDLRAHPDDQ